MLTLSATLVIAYQLLKQRNMQSASLWCKLLHRCLPSHAWDVSIPSMRRVPANVQLPWKSLSFRNTILEKRSSKISVAQVLKHVCAVKKSCFVYGQMRGTSIRKIQLDDSGRTFQLNYSILTAERGFVLTLAQFHNPSSLADVNI